MSWQYALVASFRAASLQFWQAQISRKRALWRQLRNKRAIKLKRRKTTSKTRSQTQSRKTSSRSIRLLSSSKWPLSVFSQYLWPCLFKNLKKYREYNQKLTLMSREASPKRKMKTNNKCRSWKREGNLTWRAFRRSWRQKWIFYKTKRDRFTKNSFKAGW